MPYTYTTLAAAQQQLANRLNDSSMQFWSPAELTLLIRESLQTFNAYASFWRGEFTFSIGQVGYGLGPYGLGPYGTGTVGTWYDLSTEPGTLRPRTTTDLSLYQSMEYSLLEPQTTSYPLSWQGSAQFAMDDLIEAVNRRRDELLGVTGCTPAVLYVPAAGSRTVLSDDVLEVQRVAFIPNDPTLGSPSVLWPVDEWGLQSYKRDYTTSAPATPSFYYLSTEPPLSFSVDAPPAVPGQYEVTVLQAGTALSAAATAVLPVPDDWAWVIRWGALADLLGRESNAKDSLRAKYAEQRYRQGLALLTAAPSLLSMRINNVPVPITSVRGADTYDTTWEARTPAQPQSAMTAGLDLVAFSPLPDAEYIATATVVRAAPVPSAPTDPIQVGRDIYDVILDYAQHLAAFKMGGAEFAATLPLLDRFIQVAALQSSKLAEQGEFQSILYGLSQRESGAHPRYTPDLDPATQGAS